jgi:hypothetical protein
MILGAVDPASQLEGAAPAPSWRSDTLVLAGLNALAYLAFYWHAGWEIPHFGTYIGWIGAVVSLVPAVREVGTVRFKRSALVGVGLSFAVLLHAWFAPCTGPCK